MLHAIKVVVTLIVLPITISSKLCAEGSRGHAILELAGGQNRVSGDLATEHPVGTLGYRLSIMPRPVEDNSFVRFFGGIGIRTTFDYSYWTLPMQATSFPFDGTGGPANISESSASVGILLLASHAIKLSVLDSGWSVVSIDQAGENTQTYGCLSTGASVWYVPIDGGFSASLVYRNIYIAQTIDGNQNAFTISSVNLGLGWAFY